MEGVNEEKHLAPKMARPAVNGFRFMVLLVVAATAACRGEAPGQSEATVSHLIDSLTPMVEESAGLAFKTEPRWALRDEVQLRSYLEAKFAEQLPPELLANLQATYRLLGLVPDTVEVAQLLLDVLQDQVLGFYEPDSATLFIVSENRDPTFLRLTVAHELVHALQAQYLPLDSLLDERGDNDRTMARQAILEGHANFASFALIAGDRINTKEFWDLARQQGREATAQSLPHVPLILRETVLFPYMEGAEFIRWWRQGPLADTVPFGNRTPISTEQVIHPERYLAGEVPVELLFPDSSDAVLYQDDLGEFELRVLHAVMYDQVQANLDLPMGWNGDRYRLYSGPDGPALVWFTAWDDARFAERFASTTGARLAGLARARPGYHGELTRLEGTDVPIVRIIIAPEGWECPGGCTVTIVGSGS